ncbi:ABC transporter permease [Roseateles sp.]|uniref:ABC transporter permease n=1 Tax=Roseateles sp. TaxID=1971397 RepID=UPI0039EC7FD0
MNASQVARLASVPLLIALWQGVSALQFVNPVLFPSPWEVAHSLWDYLGAGDGWADLLASLSRVGVGYVVGAAAGVLVGIHTGTRPFIAGLLSPALQLLRPIPPIAFVPVVIVWFGLTEWGKWFLVCWGVFFAVWLSAHMGVQRVNENLVRAALSLGTGRQRLLWTVQLPAAAPVILVGLRTAVSIAFYTLVAAELAGAFAGIAYRMEISQQNMQIGHTMAGLVLLGVVSACADKLFEWGSTRLVHWKA